ncbi:MAG: hypothetical protein PVJ63_05800 [Thioalkalispiraceae bacterium]|jgi:hypothetical protein
MKKVTVLGGFMAMVLAMPVAMAQQDGNREQRQEQFMEQDAQREMQHMEKRQERIEMHEEHKQQRKEMYQNQLKEKQDDGYRMKGGPAHRK